MEAAAAGGGERVVGVDRRVVEGDDLALRPLEFAQERLLVDPAGEPAHGLEVDAGQIGDPLRHPLDRRGVCGAAQPIGEIVAGRIALDLGEVGARDRAGAAAIGRRIGGQAGQQRERVVRPGGERGEVEGGRDQHQAGDADALIGGERLGETRARGSRRSFRRR